MDNLFNTLQSYGATPVNELPMTYASKYRNGFLGNRFVDINRGENPANIIPKGMGYFGNIGTTENPMTEFSITPNIDGKPFTIPSIVPTLTAEDLDYLRNNNKVNKEIVNKAIDHAIMRMKNGLSPYAEY